MPNITEVPKKPYSTRLDADLLKWLEEEAKRQNRPVANLIDTILLEYRAKNTTKPKPKKK